MIARQISFFAPAAVMSAWATVMLHTIATGHINRLLSPLFRNYVLIAALLLLALSVLYVLLYQPTPKAALAPAGRLRQFGRWLVLLIPVVAASVLSPTALSKTTASNRLDSTAGVMPMPSYDDKIKKAAQEALAADPNVPVGVEVTDLITLGHSPDQIKAFDGRAVRSIGLFVQQPGQAPKLVRWIMWCCAADAMPASVELSGKFPTDWKDTQYIEVTGKARFPSQLGHVVPTIEVDSIKPVDEPDEPYLSP